MLVQYQFKINPYALSEEVARGFAMSFPVDWKEQIRDNGPLPVVVFFHGGNQAPVYFMDNSFRVPDKWWRGEWVKSGGASAPLRPEPVKAIAIFLQGITLDSDLGGDWNAGNMGAINRFQPVDDESYALDAIERAEQYFVNEYNAAPPPVVDPEKPVLYAELGDIFDRKRLSSMGFSEGGQMAYRMVNRWVDLGWTMPGLVIFGSSIGGWRSESSRAKGDPPVIDWTPRLLVFGGDVFPSLLHIHGTADDAVPHVDEGPTDESLKKVADQFEPAEKPRAVDFVRADISGLNSAVNYETMFTSVLGAASALTPATDFPGALSVPPVLTAFSFGTEWLAGKLGPFTHPKRVIFANVKDLDHSVPFYGSAAVIQFLQSVGGL